MSRTIDTISQHFWHKDLRTKCEDYISRCDACQKHKLPGKGYGELPPRNIETKPWQEVAVDLIGPWSIRLRGQSYQFRALTMIDTVTNFCAIKRIDNKSANHVSLQFEIEWLARYPRPTRCVCDQGTEFLGYHFMNLLQRYNIRPGISTVKNPMSNSIVERLHQTIANTLRATLSQHQVIQNETFERIADLALQRAAHAVNSTVHRTLKTTPGALVFQRDMILNIPMIADLQFIADNRQQLVDRRTMETNRKRISYDYQPNDEVLVLAYKPDKLDARASGPFRILETHCNGTVVIQRAPNLTERINIRRIRPYRR